MLIISIMREYSKSYNLTPMFTCCISTGNSCHFFTIMAIQRAQVFSPNHFILTFYILHCETWNSYSYFSGNPTDPNETLPLCLTFLGTMPSSHPNRNHQTALVARRTNILTYPKACKEATSSPTPFPVPVPVTVPAPAQSEQHSWRAWAGFVMASGAGGNWGWGRIGV